MTGPLRSRAVAEAVEVTAPARIPLLAPVATCVGITRDDEPGRDDDARAPRLERMRALGFDEHGDPLVRFERYEA